ncbi:MAG: DNA polymerase I [Tissierellaceae bacterium]|nr:DNA polymerase I [Tissierellaceae bacterium]
MDRKKLMVIDGSSLLHRAFYALPLLSNKEGIYTNGLYGFLTMLYKVQEDINPDYLCIVFDKKGPTFRHKEYDKYKAHRSATPSELAQQFPIMKDILEAMNISYLELSGYEADDIAGAIAKKGEKDYEIFLVTGDKDYLQLATDNTKVLITRKGITEIEEYDRNKIIDEFGITPHQLIDLKGLMGDASDNIPGVPGIGEKTGLKLLKEYDTIENIYENLDNIKGKKLKENLTENKQLAFLSRRLGEIMTTVPTDIDIDEFQVKEPKWDKLKSLYENLEFNSLLKKITFEGEEVKSVGLEYNIIKDNQYSFIIKEIEKEKKFSFKIITAEDNYIESEIIGIGIKTKNKPTNIILFEDDKKKFFEEFKTIFEDEKIEKIGHNLKKEIVTLLRMSIQLSGMSFDSMIAGYLLDPTQNGYFIKNLSEEYLSIPGTDEEKILGKGKKRKSYNQLTEKELGEIVSFTLDTVFSIEDKMMKTITEQEMIDLYNDVELPLVEVLANMEYEGFKIDTNELKRLGKEYDEEIEKLTREIYNLAGAEFNINSPKQLGEILFDKLGLPIIKKTKTGYSTDAEVLDKLKDMHPMIEKVLRYRQIVKLKSTYIDGLLALINEDTKRIHSSFNQTITSTGRISSTEPNLQNIPVRTEDGRKIRKAFVAEDGYSLVDADYSQIELRILAHISKDPKLIDAFIHNEDIHRKTASEVFNVSMEEVSSHMRSSAKAVNFGIIYGISDYGLSRDLNITRKEAKIYIDKYLKNYEKVKDYMEDIVNIGKEQGYVETILHRRRYVPELQARNFNIKSFGERIAMNTPIQGSAADIIKMAMVKVFWELKKRNLKSRLILQIHDELIIEAPINESEEVKKILKDVMENSIKLDIPLLVDLEVGDSWYETK